MNEIYWITRLDGINTVLIIMIVVGAIFCTVVGIAYFITNGQVIYDSARGYEASKKENEGYRKTCSNVLKWTIPITIISCLLRIFTPTTKEALLIWGVGGTIDYIKSNPVAKKIPDKCIIALDKWVDSLGTEETDTIK